MPKWAKIVIGCAIACVVIVLAVGYLGARFVQQKYDELEKSVGEQGQQGEKVGASGTLDGCLEAVAARSGECGDEPTCLLKLTPFLWGCLDAAPHDEDFCRPVPAAGKDRAVRAWAEEVCAHYGQPGNEICIMAMTPVPGFCETMS